MTKQIELRGHHLKGFAEILFKRDIKNFLLENFEADEVHKHINYLDMCFRKGYGPEFLAYTENLFNYLMTNPQVKVRLVNHLDSLCNGNFNGNPVKCEYRNNGCRHLQEEDLKYLKKLDFSENQTYKIKDILEKISLNKNFFMSEFRGFYLEETAR